MGCFEAKLVKLASPSSLKKRNAPPLRAPACPLELLRSRLNAPLANPGRDFGQQFEFSIGCVPLCLEMSDLRLYGAALARYAAFTSAAENPIHIALNNAAPPERALPDFAYEFEGAALRAFSSDIRFDGVRNQYALDSLVRVFLSWKLLEHQGFLLHAATVMQ